MPTPPIATDYTQAPTNQQLDHIQGEYGLPFVGKTIAMFADPINTFHQHYLKFGAVSRVSITGQKVVLLLGPQYLQTILLDTRRNSSAQESPAGVALSTSCRSSAVL